MNLKLAGVGAEPKKLAMLGGLVLVAGYFFLTNRNPSGPGSDAGASASRTPTNGIAAQKSSTRPVSHRGLQRNGSGNMLEFHPSMKPIQDGAIDRASIDPTLKLDLLEKLQKVKIEGGSRSLFEFSTAPTAAALLAKNIPEPKAIKPKFVSYGPQPPAPPVKPPEAAAPPIPLKFYGFIAPVKAGVKRAFFLDGEEIIVGAEGQLLKNRYRVVRIGINSAVLEDTQFKNHQQTLPLVAEQNG